METKPKAPLLVLLAAFVLLSSKCDFNQKEPLHLNDLVGPWSEKEDPDKIQFAGSNHQIVFFDDHTFQLKLRYWTDAINPSETCPAKRTDFIKGTFSIQNNTLKYIGVYADEAFSSEIANCKGETTFTFESDAAMNGGALVLMDEKGQRIRMLRP